MGKILITTAVFPDVVWRLQQAGHEVKVRDGVPCDEDLAEAEALICPLSLRVGADLLGSAPRLRLVANLGAGVDNIDLHAASERGILVSNTPDVLTEATADLGWALLLAVARRVVEADVELRARGFPGWAFLPPHLGVDVHGKTVGVVGFGRIGQAVARRGQGFGMRLCYTSRSRREDAERQLGARFLHQDDLLRESDFVVLCVPLTPQTRHLIGARELQKMKEEAILVNVSRGPVVDEAALVAALQQGSIRGAGLDVFEHEPRLHPGLVGLKNVVVTPHIGSATVATRRRMAELACDAAIAVFDGRRPCNLVPVPAPEER